MKTFHNGAIRFVVLTAIAVAAFAACSKDNPTTPVQLPQGRYAGTWDIGLIQVSMGGPTQDHYASNVPITHTNDDVTCSYLLPQDDTTASPYYRLDWSGSESDSVTVAFRIQWRTVSGGVLTDVWYLDATFSKDNNSFTTGYHEEKDGNGHVIKTSRFYGNRIN